MRFSGLKAKKRLLKLNRSTIWSTINKKAPTILV